MKSLFITLFLCLNLSADATSYYVAQVASGNGSGNGYVNAASLSWLTNTYSWTPGDEIILYGTLTNALPLGGGGTAGNPITILFFNSAKFSAPTWNGNIISDNGYSYITIDGGLNGLMQATNNGSGMTYSNNICAISLSGCSDITIKNLTAQNFYVYKGGLSGTDPNENGLGVYMVGTGMGNNVVSNCVFHDMYYGLDIGYGAGCSNITYTHCTAYHCNWGGGAGNINSSGLINGLTVDHNHFYSWSNWDMSADNNHHNGFFTWGLNGGTASNITYCDNYVGPGYGAQNTSGLFCQGNFYNAQIYNNIFDASDNTSPADGLVYLDTSGLATPPSASYIYNNTFIGGAITNAVGINVVGDAWPTTLGNTTFAIVNNEFFSNNISIIWFWNSNSIVASDTNNFYGCFSAAAPSGNGSGSKISLAAWQGTGHDTHSTTNNPLLATNWIPQAGSSLIAVGANLTSFGIVDDYAGNARPSSGTWTVGAYQYLTPATANAIFIAGATNMQGYLGVSSNGVWIWK